MATRSCYKLAIFILLASLFILHEQVLFAQTIHVTGGREELKAALEQASQDKHIREIVLADGEYTGIYTIDQPGWQQANTIDTPPLTIRAAEGATPLFRHAIRVHQADSTTDYSNVYVIDQIPPSAPEMWERDTRVRYKSLSNVASVSVHPASCFVDRTEGKLYFSTSDGRSPEAHEVWLSLARRNSRILAIKRDNVVIDGLHFYDYININANAIKSNGSGLTIRNCVFDNIETGWSGHKDDQNILIENCVGRDVSRGIFIESSHVTVRNCRFDKTRDRFLYDTFPQNDTAIQVYYPGTNTTIIGNVCKGYHDAILIKSADSRYIIRHNTVLDSHVGINIVTPADHVDVTYNIVVGARSSINIRQFKPSFIVDYNLIWNPQDVSELASELARQRGASQSKHSMLADPRFVNNESGDYRLLPDSPARFFKNADGRPAGALDVAPVSAANPSAPTLALAFESDSKPAGQSGVETFEKDPWIGGGSRVVRSLSTNNSATRIVGVPEIIVQPRAFDLVGSIKSMCVTINDSPPTTLPFEERHELKLPDVDGIYNVQYEVQNDRGIWSKPVAARIIIDRQSPKLVGAPQIYANDHGFVVQVRSEEPCLAKLSYGQSPDVLDRHQEVKPAITRMWNIVDGGEWVQTWDRPRQTQSIAVLAPAVSRNQVIYARLTLRDQAGLTSTTDVFEIHVKGKPRELLVGPSEEDLPLQQAMDIALPGDHIILKPGVYPDGYQMTHGGVGEDARITIRAQQPGTVTFDTARRHAANIHLEKAPFVSFRNIRFLYFKKAGIYSYKSPNTKVDACEFYNGPDWVEGYHFFAFYSPDCEVSNSIALGAEFGFAFLKSPGATVTHNTATQQMYGGVALIFSASDSVVTYNSLSFSGSQMIWIKTQHPNEMRTFKSDWNNLGTTLTAPAIEDAKKLGPEVWAQFMKEKIEPNYSQYIRTASKGIVHDGKIYLTLKAWQEAHGQDLNSIFADPKYIAPWPPIDRWNFSVRPDSENLKVTDDNGKPIGAKGIYRP